jgi:hypothetical protein
MSETFTKLFGSITDSTIWMEDNETRLVWITMLAMADRHGYVGASVPGLAARARVSVEACAAALDKFKASDKFSRSPEFEGRRVEDADRGWVLLNYERFRDMRDEEARKEYERNRKREQRKVSGTSRDKPGQSRKVPHVPLPSAQADRDRERDRKAEKGDLVPAAPSQHVVAKEEFVNQWRKRYAGEPYPFVAKDGAQLATLLKASPFVGERWASIVSRYLDDTWWGEHGRHGLAALCANVVKFSGPALTKQDKQDATILDWHADKTGGR